MGLGLCLPLKAYPSLKTGSDTHKRTHLQGALTPTQKGSDHHLRKGFTTNIPAFPSFNILSLPAHPSSQGLGSHAAPSHFPHPPPVTKPRGQEGSWAAPRYLLKLPCLSLRAKGLPSQKSTFFSKENHVNFPAKEKAAEAAGVVVQSAAFPFSTGPAAHKTDRTVQEKTHQRVGKIHPDCHSKRALLMAFYRRITGFYTDAKK